MSQQLYKKEWNQYKDAWETWYWDDETEKFTIKNTFNVGHVLKANIEQANASIDQRFGKEMLHHVADIPLGVVTKLLREHNVDVFSSDPTEQKKLRKLLEDPDYLYLKTTTRKLWRPT